MRISALEEYGLRCLLALSQAGPSGQRSISEIAEKEGISIPYASKLLSALRRKGLVKALRGRGGGFCIARPAEEINLLEVLTALGGPLIDPNHCRKYSGKLDQCVHTDDCAVHDTLSGLAGLVAEFLSGTTLADINNGTNADGLTQIESRVLMLKSGVHRIPTPDVASEGETLNHQIISETERKLDNVK